MDASGLVVETVTGADGRPVRRAFALDDAARSARWRELVASGYFELERKYADRQVLDGGCDQGTVWGSGDRHEVTACNASMPALACW